MKIQVVVFRVMTLCSDMVGYQFTLKMDVAQASLHGVIIQRIMTQNAIWFMG
jgi:hypothetical protein